MLLKAALNGNRSINDNEQVPITAERLALDARAAVDLGVGAIHIHPRNEDGLESLNWRVIEPAILAVRAACPGIPIGISTREGITITAEERFELVCGWKSELDFASVNFHEEGSVDVARKLLELNIGVEAGLFNVEGAENLIASGLAEDCLRIMFEPENSTVEDALRTVDAIELILDQVNVRNPSRLLHGFDATVWPLLAEAKKRGYDSRIGFEDVLFLPNGKPAQNNLDLVRAAIEILFD